MDEKNEYAVCVTRHRDVTFLAPDHHHRSMEIGSEAIREASSHVGS
jgi:hypothetical protein